MFVKVPPAACRRGFPTCSRRPNDAVVLLAVFSASTFLVVATHRFILRRRLTAAELIPRAYPQLLERVAAGAVPILRERRASQLAFLNRLLTGKPATAAITRELLRAGSEQTAGGLILTSLLAAFVGWYIGSRFAALLGIALGALGAAAPLFYLRWQQGRRTKKFEAQLPECIDMLVNAMKAGYSLQAAMKFVGDEIPAPLGPVFARFYDEQRLGSRCARCASEHARAHGYTRHADVRDIAVDSERERRQSQRDHDESVDADSRARRHSRPDRHPDSRT